MKLNFDFGKLTEFFKSNRFNVISWGVTVLLVAALLGSTLWWTQTGAASPATRPEPTAKPNQNQQSPSLPPTSTNPSPDPSIERELQLKTNIPERPRFTSITYRVVRGDSMFGIAKQFDLKPESILYSNKDTLHDIPELAPGMELTIPPVDGLMYTWKDGDTIQKVADEFKAQADDILNWPGNNIDLTDPKIQPGTVVMIPGGKRQLIDWTQFIPAYTRGSGSATSTLGQSTCGGGPAGPPTTWPTTGPHTISGNDYGPSHQGIDITAPEGTPVLAAGNGVVVFAGWNNTGYGNVIMIDHGDGYVTVYAHLEQGSFLVKTCDGVFAGQQIASADSTGNSTGSHLHFEVRRFGQTLNPWALGLQ